MGKNRERCFSTDKPQDSQTRNNDSTALEKHFYVFQDDGTMAIHNFNKAMTHATSLSKEKPEIWMAVHKHTADNRR